ncbi:MAG: hypothetical protein WCK77_20480 [Verrucomicrobiota bacterium]
MNEAATLERVPVVAVVAEARQAMAKRGVFLVELPMEAIGDEAGEVLALLQGKGYTLAGSILEILRSVGLNHAASGAKRQEVGQ